MRTLLTRNAVVHLPVRATAGVTLAIMQRAHVA